MVINHYMVKVVSEVVLLRCSSVIDGSGSAENLTEAKTRLVATTIDAYQEVDSGGDIPSDNGNHGERWSSVEAILDGCLALACGGEGR